MGLKIILQHICVNSWLFWLFIAYLPVQEEEDEVGEEEASTSHSIDNEAHLRTSSEPQQKLRKEAAQISSKRENGKKTQGAKSKARRKIKSWGP